jgi:hypothetical protein
MPATSKWALLLDKVAIHHIQRKRARTELLEFELTPRALWTGLS